MLISEKLQVTEMVFGDRLAISQHTELECTCTRVHRQLAFTINNHPMRLSLCIECCVIQ